MSYWKKINWGDDINPGDILKNNHNEPAVVVVQKCSEMTGITTVEYIKPEAKKNKIAYWSFGYLVNECEKLWQDTEE